MRALLLLLFMIETCYATALPSDVMNHHIMPKLDAETQANYGSTSKANAEETQKFREENKIPKRAKLVCPPGEEVAQIIQGTLQSLKSSPLGSDLSSTGNAPVDIAIKGMEWTAYSPTGLTHISPKKLQGLRLREAGSFFDGEGEQLMCKYILEDESTDVSITRYLRESSLHIDYLSCKVENSNLYNSSLWDGKPRSIYISAKSTLPSSEGLEIMCDQIHQDP